jgi:hypothetical protein
LGEAGDEAGPNRITDGQHHDGNCLGRILGRERSLGNYRDDDVDAYPDQFGR